MIYLKAFKTKKPETILQIFEELNLAYNSEITFSDEECLEIQCNSSKNRSFDDIVEIVQTYLDVTPEQILKELHSHVKNTNEFICNDCKNYNDDEYSTSMIFLMCPNIDKWVVGGDFDVFGGTALRVQTFIDENPEYLPFEGMFGYNIDTGDPLKFKGIDTGTFGILDMLNALK